MSKFIILSSAVHSRRHECCTYRVNPDRIDWMADVHDAEDKYYTVVSVNGVELHVDEPTHIILDYIEDPDRPLIAEQDWKRHPDMSDYIEKFGDSEETRQRYCKDMHYPARHYTPKT